MKRCTTRSAESAGESEGSAPRTLLRAARTTPTPAADVTRGRKQQTLRGGSSPHPSLRELAVPHPSAPPAPQQTTNGCNNARGQCLHCWEHGLQHPGPRGQPRGAQRCRHSAQHRAAQPLEARPCSQPWGDPRPQSPPGTAPAAAHAGPGQGLRLSQASACPVWVALPRKPFLSRQQPSDSDSLAVSVGHVGLTHAANSLTPDPQLPGDAPTCPAPSSVPATARTLSGALECWQRCRGQGPAPLPALLLPPRHGGGTREPCRDTALPTPIPTCCA